MKCEPALPSGHLQGYSFSVIWGPGRVLRTHLWKLKDVGQDGEVGRRGAWGRASTRRQGVRGLKDCRLWAGKEAHCGAVFVAQWVKGLGAKLSDQSSIPRAHIGGRKELSPVSCLLTCFLPHMRPNKWICLKESIQRAQMSYRRDGREKHAASLFLHLTASSKPFLRFFYNHQGFCFVFLCFVRDRISLPNPDWLRTHRDPPPSISQLL